MTTAKKTEAAPEKPARARKSTQAKPADEDSAPEQAPGEQPVASGVSNESTTVEPRQVDEELEYEVVRPVVIDGKLREAGKTVKLSGLTASQLVSNNYVRKV